MPLPSILWFSSIILFNCSIKSYFHVFNFMPFDFQVPHIMCITVSSPPLKSTMPSFLPSLPLNRQTAQAPHSHTPVFKAILPSILVFREPVPLKVVFFSEPPKYSRFSSLIPSYLLKVTKFLVNISWFEFLFMTDKNIFDYKLFWSLKISDFNLFRVKIRTLHPLKMSTPPFYPSNPPLIAEVLSSPLHPILKIWLKVQSPLPKRR